MGKWKTLDIVSRGNDSAVINDSVNSFVNGEHEMVKTIVETLYSIDPELTESVVDAFACLAGPVVEEIEGVKHEMYLYNMLEIALWDVKNNSK